MGFTTSDLKAAAARLATAAGAAEAELNALDGQLGDGDLGITVATGWKEVANEALPDDVGMAFLAASKAFQRVSSSSYGTLTATALMAGAKKTKGRTDIPWSEVPALVASARDAMMERGKGALGDKSVLDILDAVARAIDGMDDPRVMAAAATAAADVAMGDFREQAEPARPGADVRREVGRHGRSRHARLPVPSRRPRGPVAASPSIVRGDPDIDRGDHEDDQAEQHAAQPFRHLQDGEERGEHGQDQRADDGAGVAAAAAEDRRAADHRRRDRGQEQRLGERQRRRLDQPDIEEAGDGGEEAGDDVDARG